MSKWHGELRLVAIDGDRIVFHLHPDDEVKLTIGRRYGVALVEISDTEGSAALEPERRSSHHSKRSPSNVAAILCKQPAFQRYAVERMRDRGDVNLPRNEVTATEYIRRVCGISTRADLDRRADALEKFHAIELEFYRSTQPSEEDVRSA